MPNDSVSESGNALRASRRQWIKNAVGGCAGLAVGSLMESDRDDEWDRPNGSQGDDMRQLIHSAPHPRCGRMAVTSTSIMKRGSASAET